jgi:hypothetical protein
MNQSQYRSVSQKPFVLSLSKDFLRFRQPFDKLRANGLFPNSIETKVSKNSARLQMLRPGAVGVST